MNNQKLSVNAQSKNTFYVYVPVIERNNEHLAEHTVPSKTSFILMPMTNKPQKSKWENN